MAIQNNANIQSIISWMQNDSKKISTIYDSGSIGINTPLTNGTGVQQINSAWHNTFTLPSGGSITLDMTNLSQTILGETVSKTFVNIKAIIVKNSSIIDGYYCRVVATGSNPLVDIFGGNSGVGVAHPYGSCIFAYPKTGWNITGSNKNLSIQDAGMGCSVEIAIVGVTG